MSENFTVGWVKPPLETDGLDHLGAQAPCIVIYNQLLPGITNVTNRARYYSFYLWCFVEFERQGWTTQADIISNIRKADCLFTLISLRHGMLDNDNFAEHAEAAVGSDTLTSVLEELQNNNGGHINLSNYTHLEPALNRYFKAPLGGFGQYYFGVLQQLKLMGGNKAQAATIFEETGTPIGESFEHNGKGKLFIDVIKRDTVTIQDLDDLQNFCHCRLKHSVCEKDILIKLFQGGWPAITKNLSISPSEDDLLQIKSRSQSLALFIELAAICHKDNILLDIVMFRGLTYSGHTQRAKPLEVEAGLDTVSSHWQVYQRNEILAVGLQGVLFVILSAIKQNDFRKFKTIKEACHWFWHEGLGFGLCNRIDIGTTLYEYLQGRASRLPHFSDWVNQGHECQISEHLVSITNKRQAEDELLDILSKSLDCLAAVCCRPENRQGYGNVWFRPKYFDFYPINLNSALDVTQHAFANLNLLDALSAFSATYVLESHVRVAMRKLFSASRNTSRFEVYEDGLYVKSIPPVTHTSPRFNQAINILTDLGLLINDQGFLMPSPSGKAFVRAIA